MRALAVSAAILLSGCGSIGFQKHLTDDELRLQREVRDYYAQVQRAFAAGNSQALASLFDASIVKPMTKKEIEAWGEKFFGEHGRGAFKLKSLTLDDLGRERAVVTIKYEVTTPTGKGGFGGTEQDTLVKRSGRWYTAEWEKLP
jgi:hypothetical protein